jgi:hypothetical protein
MQRIGFVLCLLGSAAALDSLDPKIYPRDFKQIPLGTDYGTGEDFPLNEDFEESSRVKYLETSIIKTLNKLVEVKKHPTFTTALIAGDMVILDAIIKVDVNQPHPHPLQNHPLPPTLFSAPK